MLNQGALSEWTSFLEQLRNELGEANAQLTETASEVGRLESQVRSVEDAIAAYQEHHHLPMPVAPLAGANGMAMTLTERRSTFLRDTARRNGGRLVRLEVRDGMIQAGLFRDATQFRQQVGRLMEVMECWERVGRGTYRLVTANGQEH